MPFVRLHISREICKGSIVVDVARAINRTIAAALSVPVERVKTVVHQADAVLIGEAPATCAYLEVTCMLGREKTVISRLSDELHSEIRELLSPLDPKVSCSVYITESAKHLLTTDNHVALENCPR